MGLPMHMICIDSQAPAALQVVSDGPEQVFATSTGRFKKLGALRAM